MYAVLLTFVVSFAGATVEQKVIYCNTVACVSSLREDAAASRACTRFRVWPMEDWAPLDKLRTFVWPPLEDWSKV